MNILHLKYVVCIAETGSINKAAEELHVAQPNLSRVVREMETDLGICFFRRSSRGMLLTPDGELFVNQARRFWSRSMKWKICTKKKNSTSSAFPSPSQSQLYLRCLRIVFPDARKRGRRDFLP